LIITNAFVYDGFGGKPYRGSLYIEGGTITKVERQNETGETQKCPQSDNPAIIDAQGKVVCPGFVDVHRHADLAAFIDPDFGKAELSQGITTTVVGNCGMAPVPMPKDEKTCRDYYEYIQPMIGAFPLSLPQPLPQAGGERLSAIFKSYDSYAKALHSLKLPLSMYFLAGAGTVKVNVKGFAKSAFSTVEMKAAQKLIHEAMEAGALGLSFGIMYQPEFYSSLEELAAMAKAAREAGGRILCTHIRGEGDSLVESVNEMIEVAARAGIPLNISHFKATGKKNWRSLIFKAIDAIEKARAKGQTVTADFYPYAGGSTTVMSLIPPDILEETPAMLAKKLETKAGKEALRKSIYEEHFNSKGTHWDNMVKSIGWERVLLCENGKSLKTIADEEGYEDPAYLLADLVLKEEGRTTIIVLSMDPSDVDAIAKLPWTALISDALYGGGPSPHPRLNGAFPHFLRDFVKDRHILEMETAINKMTAMPASRFGLDRKGRIEAGADADILIFDPENFQDNASYTNPNELSTGLDKVIINGKNI
jgi:N-acyl-D-aspartate/D-glutamate deacylase